MTTSSYVKTIWVQNSAPYINATHLANLENMGDALAVDLATAGTPMNNAMAAGTDPAVAALVSDPTSDTGIALAATYVTATVDGNGGVSLFLNGVEL